LLEKKRAFCMSSVVHFLCKQGNALTFFVSFSVFGPQWSIFHAFNLSLEFGQMLLI
jgi:hypothetical protein